MRAAIACVALAALGLLTASAGAAGLPDGRGWELVSPVEKNGGSINGAGSVAGGGVLQASADGSSVTYSSAASFGDGAQSAPAGSQYLSIRGEAGWATENLTVPIFSGSFGTGANGVPYQLFSTDLSRGLLLNGLHCRALEGQCPVANPPLAGTDAPAGYQDYYLREAGAGFEALLGADDVTGLEIGPADFDLELAGATPDLAARRPLELRGADRRRDRSPARRRLQPEQPQPLRLVRGLRPRPRQRGPRRRARRPRRRDLRRRRPRLLEQPQQRQPLPRAGLRGQSDRHGGRGGGTFQTATPDGGVAFFTKAGHLWRYDAAANTAADITPAGGVLGMLGASADGSVAYFATAAGVFRWSAGTISDVAEAPEAADPGDYPPASGTARVSADGGELLFVSDAVLTGYDNRDQKEESLVHSEVFLYSAGADVLRCVSCRPNGQRPTGSGTIPGSVTNGQQAGATSAYKPRVLSADGGRGLLRQR